MLDLHTKEIILSNINLTEQNGAEKEESRTVKIITNPKPYNSKVKDPSVFEHGFSYPFYMCEGDVPMRMPLTSMLPLSGSDSWL